MGYDLTNVNGKYFRWNIWGWAEVVNLALAYGWQPKGTELEYNDEYYMAPISNGKRFHKIWMGVISATTDRRLPRMMPRHSERH